jgi:hypothetical protein
MSTQLQDIPVDATDTRIEISTWRGVYKAGGVSAMMVGALLLVEMIVYIVTSAPSLTDAAGWFALFQNNRFVGLVDFGMLELLALGLYVPMFLAFYAALKRASESYVAIAAVLALVGIAANFATNKLFTLLALSDLYAAETTAALKFHFLAAGQAVLAVSAQGGIGGSVEGGLPLAVAGLVVSAVMLRSRALGRAAGYAGILANGMGLAMDARAALAPTVGGSPFFGAFFLLSVIWYLLIARGLFQLGHTAPGGEK